MAWCQGLQGATTTRINVAGNELQCRKFEHRIFPKDGCSKFNLEFILCSKKCLASAIRKWKYKRWRSHAALVFLRILHDMGWPKANEARLRLSIEWTIRNKNQCTKRTWFWKKRSLAYSMKTTQSIWAYQYVDEQVDLSFSSRFRFWHQH